MIEFCGELNFECKHYIRKKIIKKLLFIILPIVLFLISILAVAGIIWYDFSFLSFLLGALVVLSAALCFFGIKKSIYYKIPNKVTIKDGIIEIESNPLYQHSAPVKDNSSVPHLKIISKNNWRTVNLRTSTTLTQDGTPDVENYFASRKILEVKKVIDMGKWYQFVFYFGYKSHYFACQKDLIVNGTIKEFEALFEDKIESANY